MSLTKKYLPKDGYTHLLEQGELGNKDLQFGILNLPKESTYFDHTDTNEVLLIALSGECRCLVGHNGNKANGILRCSKDIFHGSVGIAYIPHHTTYEIITINNRIELGICRTKSDIDTAAIILDEGNTEIQTGYQLQMIENELTSEWFGEAIIFNKFQTENGRAIIQLFKENKKARIVLYNNELLVLPEKTRANLLSYKGNYYQLTIQRTTHLQ